MAKLTRELRLDVTEEMHLILNAYAEAHGIDKAVLVRDVLGTWAQRQIHANSIFHKAMKGHGITAESGGVDRREDRDA